MKSLTRPGRSLAEAEGGDDEDIDLSRPNGYVCLLALIACLNSTNLGYDIGSVGGASILMQDQLGWTDVQTEWFVASANFVAVPGALLAPYLCDGLGRRRTFTASCIIFIMGVSFVVLAPSLVSNDDDAYPAMMVGRVLTGFGIGVGLAIDPLYIAEVSPSRFRGKLVSMSEISINVGILLGMAADYAFLRLRDGVDWKMMLGLGLILPSILLVMTLTVMPESPRWLISKGFRHEAIDILKKTHHPSEEDTVKVTVSEIEAQIAFDDEIAKQGWKPIFSPTPSVRRMLLAGVGLGACQQLNGSEAFIYFSPVLLEDAGFETKGQTFGITLLIGFCKTGAIAIGAYLVDSWGRRPLLFLSTGLMTVFLLILAASFPGGDGDNMRDVKIPICIFAMCAFVASFSVGVGPVCWAGASEVFPLHIRAKALSLATSSNRLVSATVAGTTLTLRNALGVSGFFVFYAFMTIVSAMYLYKFFPETKGRSLEEITDLFCDPNDRRSSISLDGSNEKNPPEPKFEVMSIDTNGGTT